MPQRSLSNSALVLLLLALVGALYYCTQLHFFHDLKAFFPDKDTDLDFYEEHRARFESDDNFVYIGLTNEPSVFDSSFLAQVAAFTDSCKQIHNIYSASSLCSLKDMVISPLGPVQFPILHYDDPFTYRSDSIRIFADERLVNRYISQDATCLSVILKNVGDLPEGANKKINSDIESMLSKFGFADMPIAGRIHSTSVMIDGIVSELQFYTLISAAFVFFVLIILLQRFWGVILSFTAVVIGMILFMGFIGFSGQPLTLLSSLFPILSLVVGMSDVIHITSKYLDELHKGKTRKEAMRITVREIGLATLMTSLTTAVGFMSLYTSNISVIRQFGMLAAAGVFIAYLSVIIFSSAVLIKFGPNQIANLKNHHSFWDRLMESVYRITLKYRKLITAAFFTVMALCALGISMLSTNTYILSDIPRDTKLWKDFHFFEDKLSGIRPFELAVEAGPDRKLDELEVLQQIDNVETYIKQEQGMGTVVSPATLYKSIRKAHFANQPNSYKLAETEKEHAKYEKQIHRSKREEVNMLISSDKKYGRISSNVRDMGSDTIRMLNDRIMTWIAENTDAEKCSFRLTGTGLIVDKNHSYLRGNLLLGLTAALLVVSLFMAVLFRSLKMALISMIPNIIPLFCIAALMGFLDITLMASSSIIFTISFGIAVDDTIHFLSKFRLELAKGRSVDQAIHTTLLETGKALCITTVVLFFGFMVLAFSAFQATSYIGLLISFTLLIALISDLFVLPVLLSWFYKNHQQKPS